MSRLTAVDRLVRVVLCLCVPVSWSSASTAGVVATDAPPWVTDPQHRHPAYPREQYVVGFGEAEGSGQEALDRATVSARQAIAQEIEVRISGTLEVEMRAEQKDDAHHFRSIAEQVSRMSFDELISGCERIADHQSDGRRCALAALRRDTFAAHMLDLAEQEMKAAEQFEQTATDALTHGDPAMALTSLLRSERSLAKSLGCAAKAQAVLPRDPSVLARGAKLPCAAHAARIEPAITRLFAQTRLTILRGDEQKGRVGGALSEPVELRVIWDGGGAKVPVANVPVRVLLQRADDALVEVSATTDRDGRATARLARLRSTGESLNRARFVVDLEQLAGGATSGRELGVTFTYVMPTAAQTRVLIAVREEIDGAAVAKPLAGAAIEQSLAKLGLAIAPRDESMASLSGEDLRQRVADSADFIITGSVSASYSSTTPVGVCSRATISLAIVDVASGQALPVPVELGNAAKQFHRESKQLAGAKAIRKALESPLVLAPLREYFAKRVGNVASEDHPGK